MGSTKQTTQTNSQTDPYAPTIGPLNTLTGQIGSQLANTTPNANENFALGALTNNALAGNPYAPAIGQTASQLLSGGTDRTGMATNAYSDYKNALTPTATQDTNPYTNPAFVNATNTMSNDIMDRIKAQYAGAGYTPTSSGDFGQQVARGISQGVAPTYLQAFNDLTNQKLGAIGNIYSGANTTTGLLSGLDQTALANRQAGIGASSSALQANDSPYLRLLQVEALNRGLPLQNMGQIENLLLPIAQAGGTQSGTSVSQTQVPVGQQVLGGLSSAAGLIGLMAL